MKRRTNAMTMTNKNQQQQTKTTPNNNNNVFARTTRFWKRESSVRIRIDDNNDPRDDDDDDSNYSKNTSIGDEQEEHKDFFNYALLIVLYTLQGIPMGLSASIPFLIQQKVRLIASTAQAAAAAAAEHVSVEGLAAAAAATTSSSSSSSAAGAAAVQRLSYNANAIFALCSWPFSMKLLWAPIVDACFLRQFGRRKSWLVPVQTCAGLLMIGGARFVERQLGLGAGHDLLTETAINVRGVTAFFFVLYFLMATQDIAVDGWSLTMLSKKNRGRGPVCNSIGQNIGYFLSFVGFLALNDAESSESLWRPLLNLPSRPDQGLVSLGTFIKWMGYFMLATTAAVALFKKELPTTSSISGNSSIGVVRLNNLNKNDIENDDDYQSLLTVNKKKDGLLIDEDQELDASQLGLRETYHRLWEVCKLPSVRWLFLILLTYRLPTSLSDNVKFLKAVEYGLSKSTTALLSPTVILPLGILVPIVATKIWHNTPFQQFMAAYKFRVTLVPLLDTLMLVLLQRGKPSSALGLLLFWAVIVMSTAAQAIVNSMQFNAQMTFFAKRVDPAIGGSYMTLLNTAANLGGTWPASLVMWLVSVLSRDPKCTTDVTTGVETCVPGRDPFFVLQAVFSMLGCLWIAVLGRRVRMVSHLPDDAWRTHILDQENNTVYDEESLLSSVDVELNSNQQIADDNAKRK